MMTSSKVMLLTLVIAALYHSSSALFYTTSDKDSEYPRIGKRPFHVATVHQIPSALTAKMQDNFLQPEPEEKSYIWSPISRRKQDIDDIFGENGVVDGERDLLRNKFQLVMRRTYNTLKEQINELKRQQLKSYSTEDDYLPQEI